MRRRPAKTEGALVMKNLIVLTLAIAFCLPVHAETLVFQTSTSGQQLNIETKVVEKISELGYLIIDADLSDPNNVVVNEAYHLHYKKIGNSGIQYTTILSPDNMEIILVNYSRYKKMTIRWFDDPTGTYTVVIGTATLKDLGGGLWRYAAVSPTGSSVWREQDFRTGSGSIRLSLNTKATSLNQGKSAPDITAEYENMLTLKGYNPE